MNQVLGQMTACLSWRVHTLCNILGPLKAELLPSSGILLIPGDKADCKASSPALLPCFLTWWVSSSLYTFKETFFQFGDDYLLTYLGPFSTKSIGHWRHAASEIITCHEIIFLPLLLRITYAASEIITCHEIIFLHLLLRIAWRYTLLCYVFEYYLLLWIAYWACLTSSSLAYSTRRPYIQIPISHNDDSTYTMVKALEVITQQTSTVSMFRWLSKVLFTSIQTNWVIIHFCLII